MYMYVCMYAHRHTQHVAQPIDQTQVNPLPFHGLSCRCLSHTFSQPSEALNLCFPCGRPTDWESTGTSGTCVSEFS